MSIEQRNDTPEENPITAKLAELEANRIHAQEPAVAFRAPRQPGETRWHYIKRRLHELDVKRGM